MGLFTLTVFQASQM
uniref:Uncharacterized protein n=1 Tax=Anguilla anguilla TaxID=7936 RepID=A0A0E9T6M8_ANGAN